MHHRQTSKHQLLLRPLPYCAIAWAVMLSSPRAFAQSAYNWFGNVSTSAADSDWNNDNNWFGSATPGSSNPVFIGNGNTDPPTTPPTPADVHVGALGASASSLLVDSGASLTLNGEMTIGSGGLNLNHGVVNINSNSGLNGKMTIAGSAMIGQTGVSPTTPVTLRILNPEVNGGVPVIDFGSASSFTMVV